MTVDRATQPVDAQPAQAAPARSGPAPAQATRAQTDPAQATPAPATATATPARATATPAQPRRRSRRDEILEIAVGLFAARGYHGVSMDDIGAAAGVTGPALYHHFAGKEAMLAAALIPVSERLLAGGRDRVARHPGEPNAALAALVDFHVEFALDDPAVIALHLHELDRLPDEPRHQIRRLQRLYVEEWVGVLIRLHGDLSREEARVLAHAAFGLMNSTPFIGPEVDRARRAALLRAATLRSVAAVNGILDV